jgi:poly-gamma-glutamate capsule biosynthesis protein CapA/YwtB (metallophosphatase superfamily)
MQKTTLLIIVSVFVVVAIFIAGSYHLYSSKNQDLINNRIESQKESEYFFSQKKLPQVQESEEVSLVFVGDIMLSRGIDFYMQKNNDWRHPFLKMAEFLKNADVVFGNLEGPISNKGADTGKLYSFRADPKSIEGLLYSGFDVLSLANNHAFDYGPEAFIDTQKILKENAIDYIGGGLTYKEAHAPIIKNIKGTKIAFFAYTNLLPSSIGFESSRSAVAFPNKDQLVIDIQNAKSLADVVVVSFHWGEEYQTVHNLYQEDLAHFAIDSGAGLIIGHHSHVAQDFEKYKNGYIAYSLGNFVFDQNFSEETKFGLVLEVVFEDKKIIEVKTQKINFTSSFQPFLVFE